MVSLESPHWETVSKKLRAVLGWASRQPFNGQFYLAGGTALALQLGHRVSGDLDFFSETDEVHSATRQQVIASAPQGEVLESSDGNLVLLLEGVRVGYFSYGYHLLESTIPLEGVSLAGILDIGLMKLDALISRGSRKDFYDLYFIAQTIPLPDLLDAGGQKYPHVRDFPLMAVESLLLFDNADRDVQPDLLFDVGWETVQEYFQKQGNILGEKWFRD